MISADLLLKGLGGAAVVGGATGVGVCYHQKLWIFAEEKREELVTFAARVGLVCTGNPTATTGIECSKKADVNVKVKKDSTPFNVSSITGGKIKVYKTSAGETYNNDHKFVIEEADVTTNDTDNKLEEFETYEIKKEGDDWSLTKKTDVNAGIKKALGLPEGAECDLPTNTTDVKTCALDDAKFKKINFDGKDGSISVTGASKLKISKVEGSDYGEKYKFKFVLESGQDATISNTTTIKANTNTEFKIKATPATGAPKTLTLEKAWSLDTLRVKVGIDTCSDATSGSAKECGFTNSSINLFNDSTNHVKGASLSTGDSSKKIKVELEQAGYSQGFKFYVENADITLSNGTPSEGEKKITKKDSGTNSPTYEIKEQTPTAGTKGWYLSKVTNAQGGGA